MTPLDTSVCLFYNGGMEEIKPHQIYTTEETRDFLKISESTIKRLLKREIIKAHKGEISAESKIGEGNTFTIKLPRHT